MLATSNGFKDNYLTLRHAPGMVPFSYSGIPLSMMHSLQGKQTDFDFIPRHYKAEGIK